MNPSQFWRMFEDEWCTPKYRLKKLLGAGSFGAVFLADEVVADRVMREVAIKIFSNERLLIYRVSCRLLLLRLWGGVW